MRGISKYFQPLARYKQVFPALEDTAVYMPLSRYQGVFPAAG
jgi:hypothetical protein